MGKTIQRKTDVRATAKHKVTYEWRSLLGIIGSWQEVLSEVSTKPRIEIVTTTKEYDGVYVNGQEYILK